MSNVSQQLASNANSLSNIAIIVGSVLALVGTIVNIWSNKVLDRYSDERITKNEAVTAVAQAEAAKATENAAFAYANAAKATESAAISNLKANEVEKQNIELRIKFASRRITEKQNTILVQELTKSPASFNIESMGDSESGLYAADILKSFTLGGWSVDQKNFPLGVIWEGLIIFQSSDPSTLKMANALKKAGIEFRWGNETRNKATLLVGGKPPVF